MIVFVLLHAQDFFWCHMLLCQYVAAYSNIWGAITRMKSAYFQQISHVQKKESNTCSKQSTS